MQNAPGHTHNKVHAQLNDEDPMTTVSRQLRFVRVKEVTLEKQQFPMVRERRDSKEDKFRSFIPVELQE